MRYIEATPIFPNIDKIFDSIRTKEEAVFLDSSSKGELSRFSIIACRPYLKLKDYGEYFTVNGERTEKDFSQYVKKYLAENIEENETHLPIVSGAVGYFSYDFGVRKEKVKSRHKKNLDIPESILYFYDIFIVEDIEGQELFFISNGKTQEAHECVHYLMDLVRHISEDNKVKARSDYKSKLTVNYTPEEYMTAVDNMIQYIVDGDIYVVNMTQQLQIESKCNPYDMFCELRKKNPSPFGGFFDYGDFQIVCSSPERFMQMRNRVVKTRPIKGTRKRGSNILEDQQLKEELKNSKKDQSELLMIVDLERNDLNRVCEPGTVKVTELFEVETYATVFHLVANVEGKLKEGLNVIDLLNASFPGGSITGAPKLRAMELIDQEEHMRRNLYTGCIGYISLSGDCDFNIVIRTTVYKDGVYYLGVGGGITCESENAFEYEETWQKARAILNALKVRKVDEEKYEFTVG